MPRVKQFDETAVLDKAMQFFWKKGCHGTSPQEILEELGLSRSSLYDTFGDKRTLFISALKRYREVVTSAVIIELNKSENMLTGIKELFGHFLENSFHKDERRGCFMVNSQIELAPHDEEINEIVLENRQALEDGFTKAIKKGQANGQLSDRHTPRAAARFIINSLWGLTAHSKMMTDKKVYDDIIRLALTVIE